MKGFGALSMPLLFAFIAGALVMDIAWDRATYSSCRQNVELKK